MESIEVIEGQRLKFRWHDGQIWLRVCQDCQRSATESRGDYDPCQFCGCWVMLWEPRNLDSRGTLERPELLHGGLSAHQQEIGLRLSVAPEDPGILNLIYEGSVKGSFPVQTVTLIEIQEAAYKVEAERTE